VGTVGLLEEVLEEKIETEVRESRLLAVLSAVRCAHPYETPAIHLIELHPLGGVGGEGPKTQLDSLEARVAALEAARPVGSAPASLEARVQKLELGARLAAAAAPPASPKRECPDPAAAAAAAAAVEARLAATDELLQSFAGSLAAHTEALEEHSGWLAALERRGGAGAATAVQSPE